MQFYPDWTGAYYRPDKCDGESLDLLEESLAKVPQNSHVWLAGDMNLPFIDWATLDIKPKCPSTSQHQQFITC